MCPPASKPSATIASTPDSCAFNANFTELTTCTTILFLFFKCFVHILGLPAAVKIIGTFSSIITFINKSMSGYNKGTLTPKGFFVALLHFWICSLNTSGYIDPAPIRPNPPELDTAEANFQPLAQTIPA